MTFQSTPSGGTQPPIKKMSGLLVLILVGVSFYFMFTYTGPFMWLAEAQLRWFGSYEEKITLVLTMLILMAAAAIVLLPLKLLMPGFSSVTVTGKGAGGKTNEKLSAWMVALIGLGFVVWGGYKYHRASSINTLCSFTMDDWDAGKHPATPWVSLTGEVFPKTDVTFGKQGQEDTFIPMFGSVVDPQKVRVFAQFSHAKPPTQASGVQILQGTLSPGALPGAARLIFERAGVKPASDYAVLEVGNTPKDDMRMGKIFAGIGGALALFSIITAMVRRLRGVPAR